MRRCIIFAPFFVFLMTVLFSGCGGDDDPATPPSPTIETVQGYALIPPISVSVPATFTMGSTVESNETPHQVTLTGRFSMASTEVTNGQYAAALQWAYNQGHVTATTTSVLGGRKATLSKP